MPPWERYQAGVDASAAGPWSKYAASAHEQTADEAMASPEGQKLAGELRTKADKMLLEAAGAESPVYAGLSSAANVAGLSIPRNIKAGIMSLQSGKPFAQEYQYIKDIDEAAARQSPRASLLGAGAGVISGALAAPIASAATLAGRAAQGAGLGAAYGGISELADTKDVGNAATAALGGAALGGIAPPLVEGLTRGAGAVGRAVAAPFRGAVNPEAEAARRVSMALQRDAAAGGGQLDEAALAAAQRQGQPAVVADIGGETTRALARSAANTSPEGRAALERATSERFEGQAPRVSEFVMGLGSGNEAIATREALKAQAAQANRPAYAKAFEQGEAGAWDDGLAQLAQAPVVADAIKSATRTGANKAAAEGFKPVRNPFVTLQDGDIALRDPSVTPTLQFWDAVKRNLDDKIGALQRSGENSAARDAIELRRQLVDSLDQSFPAYQEARAGAAKFFGAQDALEAGEKFVTARGKNSEFASAIAKMSAPERKLFADGFASRLSRQINETGDRRSVTTSVFQSPAARERVGMALGPEKAAEFEAFMHVESLMDNLRKALGNSTTARQLSELGLAGGLGGAASYLSGEGVTPGIFLGMLARRGKSRIDANVARRVGEMLASDNPETFKKALKMVKKSPRILNFVKAADARLGVLLSGGAEGAGRRIIDVTRGIAPGVVPSRADQENKGDIPTIRR